MKLYIDDIRPAPEGWMLARTVDEAIDLLQSRDWDEVSFDYDLGDVSYGYTTPERTGNTLAALLVDLVQTGKRKAPKCHVHSWNPAGQKRIIATLVAAGLMENTL